MRPFERIVKASVEAPVLNVNLRAKHCTLLYLGEQPVKKLLTIKPNRIIDDISWQNNWLGTNSYKVLSTAMFGRDNTVPVLKLERKKLHSVHIDLLNLFEDHGIFPDSYLYTRDYYNPHVSVESFSLSMPTVIQLGAPRLSMWV